MSSTEQSHLQMLVEDPREDLDREYKNWLDLKNKENKGTLAKAAIAMVNYGGGFIIIGFKHPDLQSYECPKDIPLITQDLVNSVISAYADPSFHCTVQNIRTRVGISHVVISTPATLTQPVISKKGTANDSIIKDRCYIRKPGPRSEPCTSEEWRDLLRRCVLANRDDLLESIRSIVSGQAEVSPSVPTVFEKLKSFCLAANDRWQELISDKPESSPSRFPLGYYEMGFSLIGASQASDLPNLKNRLHTARKIQFTGWSSFLDPVSSYSYPYNNFIELHIKHSDPHDALAKDHPFKTSGVLHLRVLYIRFVGIVKMITKIMRAKQSLLICQFGVLAKEYYLQVALLKLLKKQNKLPLDAVSLDYVIESSSNK